jgi:hypothetical protein
MNFKIKLCEKIAKFLSVSALNLFLCIVLQKYIRKYGLRQTGSWKDKGNINSFFR